MKSIHAIAILGTTIPAYVAFVVWGIYDAPYTNDLTFYVWSYAHRTYANWYGWLSASILDNGISRPGLCLLFSLAHALFGLDQLGYQILALCFHCGNTILLYFICRAFGVTNSLALTAALLFLTASSSWVLNYVPSAGLPHYAAIFFCLLGLWIFLRSMQPGRSRVALGTIACFAVSLLLYADGLLFPLILVAALLFLSVPPSLRFNKGTLITIAVCGMIAAGYLYFVHLCSRVYDYALHPFYTWNSLKLLMLVPIDYLANTLVLRPQWGLPDAPGIRYFPLVLLLSTLAYLFLRKPPEQIKQEQVEPKHTRRLMYFAAAWVVVFALPYIAIETSHPGQWFVKYVYFPTGGVCILFAAILDSAFRRLSAILEGPRVASVLCCGLVVYLMVLGTVLGILRTQTARLSLDEKYAVGKQEMQQVYPLLFELYPLVAKYGDHTYSLYTRTPFPPERLRQLIWYYCFGHISEKDKTNQIVPTSDAPYAIAFKNGHWGIIESQ